MLKLHLRYKIFLQKRTVCHPPGDKVSADVEEDKEALIVRSEGSVSTQTPSLLSQTLKVDDMQVYLLCNGRRRHGVRDHTSGWPGPAVHIKVPDE